MQTMSSKSGFSIIELVAVIAVMGILCFYLTGSKKSAPVNPVTVKEIATQTATTADVRILQQVYDQASLMHPDSWKDIAPDDVSSLVKRLQDSHNISVFDASNIGIVPGTSISKGDAVFRLQNP